MHDLIERLEGFGSPRVALVGDFMLDCYVYGDVERISPEAPVPVLHAVRKERAAGGAGYVAAAVTAMGGRVGCIGVIGADEAGEQLLERLRQAGADTDTLMRLQGRPTAVKTRYVGLAQHRHGQQMLRVDHETVDPLPPEVETRLREAAKKQLAQSDMVVLEDYNKGLFSENITPRLIADARAAGKKVIVDPARIENYRKYRSCTLLKPNRYEASLASGIQIIDDVTLAGAAAKLGEITDAEAVLITLDREGAFLYRRDGLGRRIAHRRPRSVYDVTGAGDETLAVLAVALAEGCDYEQAVELANVAGGLEVERFGMVPIRRDEIVDELRRMIGLRSGGKVLPRERLAEEVARRRARGETVVFTNGCFDLLHAGHVRYLQQARQIGHCLVLAINSDDSVRRVKGPGRPVIGQAERAEMLAALECVDYVTVFDEQTPVPLLELLRPDILVKGGTTPVVVGRELVEGYGGKVMTMGLVPGLSTTTIIDRILNGGK